MSTELFFGMVLLFATGYLLLPSPAKPLYLGLCTAAFVVKGGRQAIAFFLLSGMIAWSGALIVDHIFHIYKVKEKEAENREKKRNVKNKAGRYVKMITGACLVVQFGLLVIVKLAPESASKVFSYIFPGKTMPTLFVPLGISFYSFMFSSYLIDVAMKKNRAQKNPLKVLLFAGFPTALLQGPISRFNDLSPQLMRTKSIDIDSVRRGMLLMVFGLFKKKVIADRTAVFVDQVFDSHGNIYGGAVLCLAVLLYSVQQYCDFSGGIDIVLGGAHMMGISLPVNFRQPYFSTSLAEFWRRWHITLGAWMRDYVFYPFALWKPVNKLCQWIREKPKNIHLARILPAVLGNLLVFLLVGAWHGLKEHYIIWGLYNGVIISLAIIFEPLTKYLNHRLSFTTSKSFHVFRILRTFIIVNIGWFFDRSSTVKQATAMLQQILTGFPGQLTDGTLAKLGLNNTSLWILAVSLVFLFTISILREKNIDPYHIIMKMPRPLRWISLLTFCLFILFCFETGSTGTFMYAAF